ncbi:MAG: hypothetical protein WA821_14095 [Anaerolineales bacterium]
MATNECLMDGLARRLRSTQVLYIGKSIPGYKYAKAGDPMTASFLISLTRWFRHGCPPFDRVYPAGTMSTGSTTSSGHRSTTDD